MMKICFFKPAGLLSIAIILSGCFPLSAALTQTPTSYPSPAPATAVPSTSTPAATETPYKDVSFSPPADRFLPELKDFPHDYDTETNLLTQNLSLQAQLPLPKENVAAVSFRNLGLQSATLPQNGTYYRFLYWIIIAPNEMGAQLYYLMSQGKDYSRQAFLVVMPAAIQQTMGDPNQMASVKSNCGQSSISYVVSDPYASLRKVKQLPTRNPSGGYDAQRVLNSPPDLYLYTACRYKNVLILFWGHAPDNYDGNNSPIPEDVIAQQVNHFWDIAIQKLK
jgi:hypothetical protein